jgi:ankyrin repeat protein
MPLRSGRLATVLLFLLLLCATQTAFASAGHALLRAIIDRQPARVAILLDQGVSPEAVSREAEYSGKTALMWAAETGQADIVRMLLQYGAVVDRGNPKGGTALMYAAVAGHIETIEVLIRAGADPNHRVRHGWSPLLLATAKGHVAAVRALTGLGADPQTRDVYGWNLLMHATDRADTAMMRTLIELGLDPQATDAAGINALMLAERSNRPELVALLKGATPAR